MQKTDRCTTIKPKHTTTNDLPPDKQLKARSSNCSHLLTRLSPQPHEPKDGHHFLSPLQKISEALEEDIVTRTQEAPSWPKLKPNRTETKWKQTETEHFFCFVLFSFLFFSRSRGSDHTFGLHR
jgi:hypothetical protein